MFGKNYVRDLIDRSAENPADRRNFLRSAGAAGLGVVGAGLVGSIAGPALGASAGTSSGAGNQVSRTVPPGPAAPPTTVARPAPRAPVA